MVQYCIVKIKLLIVNFLSRIASRCFFFGLYSKALLFFAFYAYCFLFRQRFNKSYNNCTSKINTKINAVLHFQCAFSNLLTVTLQQIFCFTFRLLLQLFQRLSPKQQRYILFHMYAHIGLLPMFSNTISRMQNMLMANAVRSPLYETTKDHW